MKHARMSGRFLAALLALLMVLSTVIALPVVAEESASGAKKPLWSLDMSGIGAKDAAATDAWMLANNGFPASYVASSASYTQGVAGNASGSYKVNNVIDADGFYKIATTHSAIDGNKRGETEVPTDFFKLFYGLYEGYNTKGTTYTWEFDMRFDKTVSYSRSAGSTSNPTFTYTASDNTAHTLLYTDESGMSFFAARAGGNYDSIFRIAKVEGKDYLFAESTAITVNKDNLAEVGKVYYKDAGGQKVYLSDDIPKGGAFTSGADSFGIANICDVEKAYELTVGEIYRLRVVFEITSVVNSKATIVAHLYVKGDNDTAETYLGYCDYTYSTTSGVNHCVRLSDGAGYVSVGNMEIYTDTNASLLWAANLNYYGRKEDGTIVDNAGGYIAGSKVQAGNGINNVMTMVKALSATGYTQIGNAAALDKGLLPFSQPYLLAKPTAAMDEALSALSHPVYDLLTGAYTVGDTTYRDYFMEFDFMPTAGATARTTSVTIDGANVTVSSPYTDNGGGYIFRIHSGGGGSQAMRMAANGYLYMSRGTVSSNTSGIDGYFQYTSGSDTIYFDAQGYRYKLVNGEKQYVELRDGTPDVTFSMGSAPSAASIAAGYKTEVNTRYRLGIRISSTEFDATGKSVVTYQIFIKKATSAEWEKCIGTVSQNYYSSSSSQYSAANEKITMSGFSSIKMGGNMKAYTYACGNGMHMDGMVHTEKKVSNDGTGVAYYEHNCLYCGEMWAVSGGKTYTGEKISNACNGSYTLYTATDGASFKTDVVPSAHRYNTDGYCETCGNYSYFSEFPLGSGTKYTSVSRATADYGNGTGTTDPAYNNVYGYVDAPCGGMLYRGFPSGLDLSKSLVFELDVCLTGALPTGNTGDSAWPLLSYRTCYDEVWKDGQLVGVMTTADANGAYTGDPYLVMGDNADALLMKLSYGTWYNVQVALDPESGYSRVYVDGVYVGGRYNPGAYYVPNETIQSGDITATTRVGIQTQGGRYRFAYQAKNVSVNQVDGEDAFGLKASNTLFRMGYEDDRFYQDSEGVLCQVSNLSSTRNSFGGYNPIMLATYPGNILTTRTKENGGNFATLNGLSYREFSLSTVNVEKDGDTVTSAEEIVTLDGKKYEIKMTFAISDADLVTKSDNTVTDSDTPDGLPDALRANANGDTNLVRLSKYNESIRSVLVQYTNEGYYTASGKALLSKNGYGLSCLTSFDENGVPADFDTLRVVVDEGNNTYSVYVNDCIAYFMDGDVLTPFLDQPMPLELPEEIKNLASYREDMTYADITLDMAWESDLVFDYYYRLVRVLRDVSSVAVQEFAVSLVSDSRDVKLVGSQVRTSDYGAAEQTFDMRFIFGVDNLYMNGIGFTVKAFLDGEVYGTEKEAETGLIFNSVSEGTGRLYAYECEEGYYLAALKVTGMTETTANQRYAFEITTYTVGMDGQRVDSEVTYIVSCNGLGQDIQTSVKAAE